MFFIDVEGEVSAASMVKDSKIYIEIAKFVQAYDAITQNPNKFLIEIDEKPIDEENELLTWQQFVNIVSKCDLGFNPVPDASQLAVYYSYAMQIGSISKEQKKIATVNDIAEAQKKYYNFIDDTTAKIENQYNKQHEIASIRANEAMRVEKNISNMKTKMYLFFAGMALGVLLCGLGLTGIFLNIGLVRFFGFGNRFIGGVLFLVGGFVLFYFMDKKYIKMKVNYLAYKDDSKSVISRSDRTTNDELVLKDKLNKYQEDLKIAKYELNDKNKTYDVKKCIERLREKNKYYKDMMEFDGMKRKRILMGDALTAGIDDTPLKGRKGGDDDIMAMANRNPIVDENIREFSGKGGINLGDKGFDMLGTKGQKEDYNKANKDVKKDTRRDERSDNSNRLREADEIRRQEQARQQEEARRQQEEIARREAERLAQENAAKAGQGNNQGGQNTPKYEAPKEEKDDYLQSMNEMYGITREEVIDDYNKSHNERVNNQKPSTNVDEIAEKLNRGQKLTKSEEEILQAHQQQQ